MGCAGSKHDRDEALFLCKDRVRFIKQAMDSRYALSAAQKSYTQSLLDLGVALRQFTESETLVESSLSTSEPDKTPSRSSFASPSPTRVVEHVGSPRHSGSPLSPQLSNTNYMKATSSLPLKFMVDTSSNHYVEEESLTFPFPPPPPPPESGFSWDFFDPTSSTDNASVPNGGSSINQTFSRLVGLNRFKEEGMVPLIEEELRPSQINEEKTMGSSQSTNGNILEDAQVVDGSEIKSVNGNVNNGSIVLSRSKKEKDDIGKEQSNAEDASKFITHKAKDFIASIKDIEHRFTKASESGHEVSRMLETKKIQLNNSSELTGKTSTSLFLSAFHLSCCSAGNVVEHGTAYNVTKVITWNRSVSSCSSSSSRNPLTSAVKCDGSESGSDFIEEFCMISGSHSSTLDRLYAWERKLYDEVKASESIRRAYDHRCAQLRHQFAKDSKPQVIDKTRAIVKDLHSRVMVAIQAVNSISRRIERLRDEELYPQLLELVQGLIRMWKVMLECHHAQYITISLAYNPKPSTSHQQGELYKQSISHLRNVIECFNSSFLSWVSTQNSYVLALDSWLQKCIIPPQGRAWKRKIPFSPRQAIAPPIFALSGDWLTGINSLPSKEVTDSLKGLVSKHCDFSEQKGEEKKEETKPEEGEEEEKQERDSDFLILQTSLTSFFDQLTKFSEASVKVYESVKEGSELASDDYVRGARHRFQQ